METMNPTDVPNAPRSDGSWAQSQLLNARTVNVGSLGVETTSWHGPKSTNGRQGTVSSRTNAVAPLLLSEAEWAARHRAELDMRDKSYRRFPIGQDVGAFMRSLRVGRRSKNTLESYETVLRLLV